MWLNIIAKTDQSVTDLLDAHWQTYGRNYYSRHDYEAVESDAAAALMTDLVARLGNLAGTTFAGLKVTQADEFSYQDPVDGSIAEHQGIRILFDGGARVVFRLSGTGTQGATLRVYLERLETDATQLGLSPDVALASVIKAADEIAEIQARTGRDSPDVKT
jgi:phosphoglucomutase